MQVFRCWHCGEDMKPTGVKTPDGERFECTGCKLSAPRKSVVSYQNRFKAMPALRECVASVVRCFERDNLPARQVSHDDTRLDGVLVRLTYRQYERMREALRKEEDF